MGPNEQNQHFAELRQINCLYIHVVVLLTCLPSLDGKLERFVTKRWQKGLPNLSQTDYSISICVHRLADVKRLKYHLQENLGQEISLLPRTGRSLSIKC